MWATNCCLQTHLVITCEVELLAAIEEKNEKMVPKKCNNDAEKSIEKENPSAIAEQKKNKYRFAHRCQRQPIEAND